MRVVVKIGGTLLDSSELRRTLAKQIADAAQKYELAVVHGGGKQMTQFLAQRGIESRFVNGLRVTGDDTLDAVLKVFTGSVNHQLLADFAGTGAQAVGLSGLDANLVEAEQLDPDLGWVGRVVRCNGELLELLAGNGYLPVIACVAGDRQGRIYNVNADQMAAACAAGFRASQLIFLTDVQGVLDTDRRILPSLTAAQCERLISEAVATGGMRAKLDAARSALKQGVAEIVIAPGAEPNVLGRLLSGEMLGTRFQSAEAAVSE